MRMVGPLLFWFLFTAEGNMSDTSVKQADTQVVEVDEQPAKKTRVKKAEGSVRVFKFHAFKPLTGKLDLQNQFVLGSRYANGLVANDHLRRERYYAKRAAKTAELAAKDPELAAIVGNITTITERLTVLEGEIAALTKFVGEEHQRRRNKRCRFPEKTALKSKKNEYKALMQQQKQLSKQTALTESELDELHKDALKEHRANNETYSTLGLDFGTRWVINPVVGNLMRSPTPPKFKPFHVRQQHTVGHQLKIGKHPMTWRDVLRENTVCWVDTSHNANDHKTSNRGKRRPIYRVRLRIGKKPKAEQHDYVTFEAIFHDINRILPTDLIRSVAFSRWFIGPRACYSLRFVVERPTLFPRRTTATTGFVGIDFGYRAYKDEDSRIRAAYWFGSDGYHGELMLPYDFIQTYRHAEQLMAERKVEFNKIHEYMRAVFAEYGIPEVWAERLDSFAAWKSSARLLRFSAWLKYGDTRAYPENLPQWQSMIDALNTWARNEHRCYSAEMHIRRSWQNARNESYHLFANALADRYHTVVLEDLDLVKLGKAPGPEAEGGPNATAREQKNRTALGLLRNILVSKFQQHAFVNPAGTSKTCSSCGAYYADFGSERVFDPCQCGPIDRDLNAAINIMHRGCEQFGTAKFTVTPRVHCEVTACGGTNNKRRRQNAIETR